MTSLITICIALAAHAEKAVPPFASRPVVVVSEVAYKFGTHTTQSKGELLALIRAARVHEPVIINWIVRGGNDQARLTVEARAAEVRKMLESAGIAVFEGQVGNEVFY